MKKGNPGDFAAAKKFYASSVISGKVGIDELAKRIEKISTVSGADIRAVLYSIVDVVPQLLSNGNIVSIGDLGTFRVSISSEPSDTAEEVSAANIRKGKILFRPGTKFVTMLKTLEYKKT